MAKKPPRARFWQPSPLQDGHNSMMSSHAGMVRLATKKGKQVIRKEKQWTRSTAKASGKEFTLRQDPQLVPRMGLGSTWHAWPLNPAPYPKVLLNTQEWILNAS